MKRILSVLLSLTLLAALCILPVTALAGTGGDQTITLTVPEETSPTWTLNIPADMTVEYKATSTALTMPTITNVSDLADEKMIAVEIRYTGNFSSGSNTIPFTLVGPGGGTISQGSSLGATVVGQYLNASGYTDNYPNGAMTLNITEDAWNAAAPGTYSTVITYSSGVHDNDVPVIVTP